MRDLTVSEARRRGQTSAHLDADPTYAKLFVRRVSPLVSWAVVRFTSLSADAVTTLAIVSGVGGALLLLPGTPAGNLAAVALLQLAYLFDVADGEVARIRGTASLRGTYLDLIGHVLQNRVLYGVVGFLLIRASDSAWWAVLIALAGVAFAAPFGAQARMQVTGSRSGASEVAHARVEVEGRSPGRSILGLAWWLYRRLAFLWNYPAAMNAFCLFVLVDTARMVLGASRDQASLVSFGAVFLATLATKQLLNAVRLLRRDLWRQGAGS
jgi:phosphatidylglycerophosphate synthase